MAQSGNTIPNAQAVIKRFGGIRPMAGKMGVAVTTVQGWGKRNAIPENRRDEIIKAAKKHDISLDGLKGFANESAKPAPKKPEPKKAAASTKKPTTKTEAKAKPRAKIQTAAPTQTPQAEPQTPPAQAQARITVADLEAVRRESLRSGAVAATLIAGVITVAGLALFGGQNSQNTQIEAQRVAALENRINSVEATTMGLDQRIGQVDEQASTALNLLGATETGQIQSEGVLQGSVLETMAFLQRQVAEMGESNPESQAMSAQFEQLSQNAETQTALQNGLSELRNMVTGIQDRVQTMNTAGGSNVQAAALLLALGQFRSAVNRNGPFEQDLQIIRGLVGDNAELNAALDRLAPHAQSGVLSVGGLSDQLRVVAGDVIVAKLSGQDASLKDRMVQRLNDMVSVSKDGEPLNQNAPTPEFARAQSELARGNIAAAMREVESVEGVDPGLTGPWLEQARATMQAQGVEIMIMELVLNQIKAFRDGGLKGLERSVGRAVQDTVRDANRVLTNPAINLPPIEVPEVQGGQPDIPAIEMNPSWQ